MAPKLFFSILLLELWVKLVLETSKVAKLLL